MDIRIISRISEGIVEAFAYLIPQLSPSTSPPTRELLDEIIRSDGTYLFTAQISENNRKIVAFLTLVVYRVPTGVQAKIEDVIVDGDFRRLGIGEALIWSAIAKAEQLGVKTISLTSHPNRKAANRLYQRLGFTQPETNLYRLTINQ